MSAEAATQLARCRKPSHRWLTFSASYGVGAACLVWIFHDVNFRELLRSLEQIRWGWVAPAVLLDLLAYVVVALEWQILLRPVGYLKLWRAIQAVFAGRLANDVLPVHAGYVIRILLAARWMGARVRNVIPSLLVERLCDGGWLALGIGVTAFFVPLPAEVLRTGEVLGGVLAGGIGLIVLILLRSRRSGTARPGHSTGGQNVSSAGLENLDLQRPAFEQRNSSRWLLPLANKFLHWRPVHKLVSFVEHLTFGVRDIGQSPYLLPIIGLAFLKLVVQALAFLSLLWAYRIELPFWVQAAVFLVACVGISLPSTPASAGVFQLFCVAGLQMFGVSKPVASGFALLAFVLLTLPLSVAGFFALAHSGMTLREAKEKALSWQELRQD